MTLDLKRPAGQEILSQLLRRADVLVQNLAPGAVERLGFGDERLQSEYPQLIVCHVSGYGRTGPTATRRHTTS